MTSHEKILAARDRLLALAPEDEKTAQQLQLLGMIVPLIQRFLPDDPAELDSYLATIAAGALSCRSDGAEPMRVWKLTEDGTAWQEVTV